MVVLNKKHKTCISKRLLFFKDIILIGYSCSHVYTAQNVIRLPLLKFLSKSIYKPFKKTTLNPLKALNYFQH